MLQHGWTLKTLGQVKKPVTRTMYCMIPFIWSFQNRKIDGDRTQSSGWAGRGRSRVTATGYGVSCLSDENVWNFWWWLYNSVAILKSIEMYTLSQYILWCVNYISNNAVIKKKNSSKELIMDINQAQIKTWTFAIFKISFFKTSVLNYLKSSVLPLWVFCSYYYVIVKISQGSTSKLLYLLLRLLW